MIYEVRGSLIVYLTLITTAPFTVVSRRIVFLCLTVYLAYYGDLVADVTFLTGALLADLALVIGSNHTSGLSGARGLKRVIAAWPILLWTFGLYVGSFPPYNAELADWSRFLLSIGKYFLPSKCACPKISILIGQGSINGRTSSSELLQSYSRYTSLQLCVIFSPTDTCCFWGAFHSHFIFCIL